MYVEIARGTPANRGMLISHSTLNRYITNNESLYRSVYLYSDDAKEYVDKTDSLKNFFGIRSIDKIPVDIDKGDIRDFSLFFSNNKMKILEVWQGHLNSGYGFINNLKTLHSQELNRKL